MQPSVHMSNLWHPTVSLLVIHKAKTYIILISIIKDYITVESSTFGMPDVVFWGSMKITG